MKLSFQEFEQKYPSITIEHLMVKAKKTGLTDAEQQIFASFCGIVLHNHKLKLENGTLPRARGYGSSKH